MIPCKCNWEGCQAQEIQFDVIQGLSEQAIILETHGWRLGWTQSNKEQQGAQWIKSLAKKYTDQFKTKLAPTDKVDMSRFTGYQRGIAVNKREQDRR